MSTVERKKTIKIHDRDNVAVAVASGGLKAGMSLDDGTVLRNDIPQGHKIALGHIAQGKPILRYGEVIGYAESDIARGSWVHEAMIQMPLPPALE